MAKANAKRGKPRKQQVRAAKRPASGKRRAAPKKPAVRKKPAVPKKPPVGKKPAASKKPAAPKKPAVAKKPAARPATEPKTALTPPPSARAAWREQLRAAVAGTGPDFAAYLRGLGARGWEHADTPELAGLEQWGTELARSDRMAGIGALVRAAQYGFPLAMAAGGIGLDGMGFHASEPAMDGAPVETQIALAAAWLEAPDAAHRAAVEAGNDPTRQLQVWDDDLRPGDDRAHWWYADVGQCCGHAITRSQGTASGHSYYDWPPEVCVGRGLVIAVRGLREKGADQDAIIANVRAALVA